jgi:hypothetical protein
LYPGTLALDDDAVEIDPTPRQAEILDEIPVDRRLIDAAEIGVAVADGEVHGPVHLLVEQRVLHVPRDPGVAADPELTEPAGALVGVQRLDQVLLVGLR